MRQIGRLHSAVLSAVLACLVGCANEEPIAKYTVPKHEAIQVAVPSTAEEMQDPTDRMLAAIVLDEKTAWFFKGSGAIDGFPDDAVEQFDKLLMSMRFDGPEKPTWELGDSWLEKPGSGMRVANLMLEGVEFSVIQLPVPLGNERNYIVDNVNRWRGQLQLGRINSAQLSNLAHKVPTADEHVATVVDMLGKLDAAATRPMARASRTPSAVTPPPATSALAEQFTSDPPDHWTKQKAGMMQLAVFLAEDGDKSAKISVSTAGGAVLNNVNRWRGQVGLPPLASEDEVNAEKITLSGTDAMQVRIIGEQGKSILVAMVPHSGAVWYFKLMGDTSVVEKESDAFDQFLSTVRLK